MNSCSSSSSDISMLTLSPPCPSVAGPGHVLMQKPVDPVHFIRARAPGGPREFPKSPKSATRGPQAIPRNPHEGPRRALMELMGSLYRGNLAGPQKGPGRAPETFWEWGGPYFLYTAHFLFSPMHFPPWEIPGNLMRS